jgi:hypothetical protein
MSSSSSFELMTPIKGDIKGISCPLVDRTLTWQKLWLKDARYRRHGAPNHPDAHNSSPSRNKI